MSNDIYSEVFAREESALVDFELAFVAFIATIILAFPSNHSFYPALKVLVVVLLGITLIRRMAITSQYSDGQKVAELTMPLVSIISYLSLIYMLSLAVTAVTKLLPIQVNPLILFGVLAFLVVEILVLFQEIITRDVLLWGATRVHEHLETHRGERFGVQLIKLRNRMLSRSFAQELPPIFDEIDLEDMKPTSPNYIDIPKYIISVIIIPSAAIYAILWILEAVVGTIVVALFGLLGAMAIQFIVNFWYHRYGLVTGQTNRWKTATWIFSVIAAYYLII